MTDERLTRTLDQLLELAVLINTDMEATLPRDGLTPARAHLLWVVAEQGPSTQRALAQALDVTPRNVTGLVDALVETGFVTREPHPEDRRARVVTLTARSREVVDRMAAEHTEFARLLLADLPAERLDALSESLDEVLGRLRPLVRAQAAQATQTGQTAQSRTTDEEGRDA